MSIHTRLTAYTRQGDIDFEIDIEIKGQTKINQIIIKKKQFAYFTFKINLT